MLIDASDYPPLKQPAQQWGAAAKSAAVAGATPKQRIAVLSSYSRSLTNFRLELLRRLVEAGHSVVAVGPEQDEEVVNQLAGIGVEFVQTSMARTGLNPLTDLATLWSYWRLLRTRKIDVVIPYTMKPIVYGGIAARLAGVKRRYFLVTGLGHVYSDAASKRWLGRRVKQISILLYRLALKGAGGVFAYNRADTADIASCGLMSDLRDLTLVPGSGVDLDHYAFSQPPVGRPVFLLIARLLKDKGIIEYAEAARLVRQQYPEAEFRLLGQYDPSPAAISADTMAGWVKDGSLTYLGETTDVRPHLAECSVFVLPSYYREGIPRSILEAMSTGRAIVTTDLPGCDETVRDGVNGYLVEPRNARQLAEVLCRFLKAPSLVAEMGLRSRELAQSKFDVHAVNKLLLDRMALL
ncbi:MULTISPECIES: glycosyltransferase family 4 protein [unclassified Ensifer]|uniref:glycosyltransferase family 4 protein n=1 Tax=unclassified Ensifer TaxID=2633371 RepID=UPI0008130860|nr:MULTISPECIES: glycosyltransferase family 4 protein [unclassified Ensifer]OCP10119.1 glycosyl transferase [Ensifer sp. LC14]OCP12219.1 glycosyl transferase [Ensifer sp. LC13]OCP13035.1 glycosyl transferase [Ensifer sp. LC11]OCP33780.1 glycosyl transferase [Ensifer sp. LC499]